MIDFGGHEDVGFPGQGIRWRAHVERHRLALLVADDDRRDNEVALAFRHQDIGPGPGAADLPVDDGRITELTALPDKKVLLERRGIRFGVDRGVDRNLQGERLVQFDIGTIDAGDNCGLRRTGQHQRDRQHATRVPGQCSELPVVHHGCTSSSGHRLLPSWSFPWRWY